MRNRGGYSDFSMSNRAVDAYDRGLLPASKMVAQLKKRYPKTFRGLTVAIFKDIVPADEWHHTSCKFNETDFFSLATVFDYRHELGKTARDRRDAELDAKRAFTAMKKAGRRFIVTDFGEVMSLEHATRYPWFAKEAQRALAMTDAEYHTRMVKGVFGLMKIHFYKAGTHSEGWVAFLRERLF